MIIRASLSLYHSFGLVFLVICGLIASQNIALRQALASSPICQTIDPTHSPRVQQWIATQCQVHSVIFNDDSEPSTDYSFPTPITAAGIYQGTDYLGRAVVLQVALVIQANVPAASSAVGSGGVRASGIMAWLSGPAGTVPISGTVLKLDIASNYFLLVGEVVTNEQVAIAQETPTGLDATTLVFDPETGEPFNGQTGEGGSGSGGGTTIVGGPGGSVSANCISEAYRRFNSANKTADAITGVCMAAGMAAFALCMAVVGASSILGAFSGPLGWALAAVAALACLAEVALATAACLAIALIQRAGNQRDLADDLIACGLEVVQQ